MATRSCREMVHGHEIEDPRRPRLLLRLRVTRPDLDALKGVDVGDLVSDRVFGHSAVGREDLSDTRDRAALLAQHVVHKLEHVAAFQLAEWPIAQLDSLDLDVE
jgi:hypothetical protein